MTVLFAWPQAAKVGTRIARERLFRAAGGGKTLRALYDEQVDRIDWAFKLFERSLNLPPADGVSEIEVITVRLRRDRLDDRILAHIDKALPHPTIFEVARAAPSGDELQTAAAYKRRSEADRSQVVSYEHWRSEWMPSSSDRQPLPQAVSLDGLYGGLLRNIWPYAARPGEMLRQQAERLSQAAMQAKLVRRLDTQVRREKNFARQVELNRELRSAKETLRGLTDAA
jgi:hypothetical protein